MSEDRPQLDYAGYEKPPIEPWQPTRAAAIALIAIGSLIAGGFAVLAWMAAIGVFDD